MDSLSDILNNSNNHNINDNLYSIHHLQMNQIIIFYNQMNKFMMIIFKLIVLKISTMIIYHQGFNLLTTKLIFLTMKVHPHKILSHLINLIKIFLMKLRLLYQQLKWILILKLGSKKQPLFLGLKKRKRLEEKEKSRI